MGNKNVSIGIKTQSKNKARGGSKYQNRKVEYDGLKFDSAKECKRYILLKEWLDGGLIEGLKTQVAFVLAEAVKFEDEPRKKPAIRYVADFTYLLDNVLVVEDVKSAMTRKLPTYRIKKHLMKSVHGLEIKEV